MAGDLALNSPASKASFFDSGNVARQQMVVQIVVCKIGKIMKTTLCHLAPGGLCSLKIKIGLVGIPFEKSKRMFRFSERENLINQTHYFTLE